MHARAWRIGSTVPGSAPRPSVTGAERAWQGGCGAGDVESDAMTSGTGSGVRRLGHEGLAVLVFDGVLVPALIAADEGVRIARPALGKVGPSVRRSLRSPRTRAAVTLPLLALSLELGPEGRHAQPRGERRSPARRITQWPYAAVIEKQADAYRLDPALVAAVIEQESHFDRQAYNRQSGARGLMQLTPLTARALGVTDPTSPRESISAGCRYLRQLLSRFHGSIRLALAAYNAGPTAVERAQAVPAILETRAYVTAVLQRYAHFRHPAHRPPEESPRRPPRTGDRRRRVGGGAS